MEGFMATIKNIGIRILKDTSDHKGMPLEVEIEYAGVKSVISQSRIKDVLDLYLLYDGVDMTSEEVIEKVRELYLKEEAEREEAERIKVEEEKKKAKEKEETKETKKTKETEETKETKEERIKITGIGKAILSLLTAGIILVSGHLIGSNIVQSLRRNRENADNNSSNNETRIETPVTEVPVETTYSLPVDFGNDVIAPPTSIEGSENLPYINGSTTDWIAMSDAEYLEALNSQTIACQMNMPEISLFLEGEPLEGSKQLTNIQKTFRTGSVEYCIVEYFNEFRNEVVNAAYDTQNPDTTRAVLEHHVAEIYLFAIGQRSIAMNTPYGIHEYNWNDLSEEAKNAVLDVLFSFAIALPHDYVVRAEGVEITPVALAQFYESTLANLTLVNPTNKR